MLPLFDNFNNMLHNDPFSIIFYNNDQQVVHTNHNNVNDLVLVNYRVARVRSPLSHIKDH